MRTDVRYAIRGLAHARRLTCTLVLTLALGVGASVALYSAAHALLFRAPSGVLDPSTLADVYTSRHNGSTFGPSSYADVADLRTLGDVFSGVVAYATHPAVSLRVAGHFTSGRPASVSDDFFDVLGLRPSLGTLTFTAGEAPDSREAVLSYELWQAGGTPADIVGTSLTIQSEDYRIIGVAPPRFAGLHVGQNQDVWVRFPHEGRDSRGDRTLSVVARLRPTTSLIAAQPHLQRLAGTLSDRHPETNRGTQSTPDEPRRFTAVRYSRLEAAARPQAAFVGTLLLWATALALLSGCANAGSLLLARALARRREFALKLALGADRARLARVVLLECVLLAAAGTGLGVFVSFWLAGTLNLWLSPEDHALLDLRPDAATGVWLLMAGTVAGAAVGLIPALGATRFSLPGALRVDDGAAGDAAGRRLRDVVLGAQVTLSTVLLVGSALLVGGLADAAKADYVFLPERAAVVTVKSSGHFENAVAGAAYQREAARRLSGLPGVDRVAMAFTPPLSRPARRSFRVVHGSPATAESLEAGVNYVSIDYLRALSIPVVQGRALLPIDDRSDSRSVVVNEAFALRYLARAAAGTELHDDQDRTVEVVGVIRNEIYRALQGSPEPMVFYPMSRGYTPVVHLIVRAGGDITPHLPELGRALAHLEGGEVRRVVSFESHVASALMEERIAALLVVACGASALCLTILGVFGITSDAVRRRTREIGVRMALGAPPADIVRLVSTRALAVAAGGASAGVLSAFVLLRIVRSMAFLPGVDLTTVAGSTALLAGVVSASAVLPAWRALRVSPLTALRHD
ncbi:MAG TPA: ABC transporter permease [Vicinamibacterales bacterium]|nr:ABC transporter permease [Vicinamibacterales bacterium]